MTHKKNDIHIQNSNYRKNLTSAKLEANKIEKKVKENIEISLKLGYKECLAESYEILGGLYTYLGNSREALIAFKKSEDLIVFNNLDEKLFANLCNTLVVYYIELVSNYENAAKYCKLGIDIAKKNNMHELYGKLTLNMGVIFLGIKEYKNGLNSSFLALEYYDATKNERSKMFCYSNIAAIYFEMGDKKKAYEFFKKSYDIAVVVDNIIIFSDSIRGISKIEFEKGNFDKSFKLLEETIFKLNKRGNKGWEIDLTLELIELQIKHNMIESAEIHLLNIEKVLLEINNIKFCSKFYFYKSMIMELKMDYKNAYFYHKKYFELNEKLKNEEANNKLNKIINTNMENIIKRLNTISDIGKKITSVTDFESIFKTIHYYLNNLIDASIFGIGNLEGNYINFKLMVENDYRIKPFKINRFDKNSFAGLCINNDEEILIGDMKNEYSKYVNEIIHIDTIVQINEVNSLLVLPLKIDNKIIGVITTQSYKKNAYSIEDIEILRIIASYSAISLKNASQSKELKKLAITDGLTGLYNRRYFNEKSFELFNKSKKEDKEVSFMIIDIDRFKNINDTYGHKIGDLFLEKLSRQIDINFSDFYDFSARIGGEEFALVFYDKEESEILKYGENFRKFIEKDKMFLGDKEIGITISGGISSRIKNKILNPDLLFTSADNALYMAKETGRNKIIID